MDKEIFESINLHSTVVVPKVGQKQAASSRSTRTKTSQLAQSVSGTSDDDRYDIEEEDYEEDSEAADYPDSGRDTGADDEDDDPADLLLFPTSKSQSLHLSKKIPEDQFFSNPSQILSSDERSISEENEPVQHASRTKTGEETLKQQSSVAAASMYETIRFPGSLHNLHANNTQGNSSTESPLEFLTNKNKVLFNEINHNIKSHHHYLVNGDDRLKRVRSMISQNFEQISENYYSLNELYTREIASTEALFDTFEKWDKRRAQLLDKIRSIKDPKNNKHGQKLAGLLDESGVVDKEIDELEAKLVRLRAKKQLINTEIETTSSVLESKTARYVDIFKNLESQGKSAIINYLQYNGSENNLSGFVKNTPVDVTFFNEYIDQRPEKKKEIAEAAVDPTPVANTMGIQPFIIPDSTPQATNTPPVLDRESYDHGHGPSAYDKGYQMGAQQSINAVRRLQDIIEHLKQSIGRASRSNFKEKGTPSAKTGRVSVDDIANTITEKVDLDPIVQLLEHKISAVSDLLLHTSSKATIYHQYNTLWQDVTNILDLQEKKLLAFVTESRPTMDAMDPSLEGILTSTLMQLKSCIENLIQYQSTLSRDFLFGSHNPLHQALLNEITSIVSALTIFSKPSSEIGILRDFITLGFTEEDLLQASTEQDRIQGEVRESSSGSRQGSLPGTNSNSDATLKWSGVSSKPRVKSGYDKSPSKAFKKE